MKKTRIIEPTGYGMSVSTANDLLLLSKWMKSENRLHKYLMCKEIRIERLIKNTNMLINRNILGKTGFGINDRSSFVGFT